MVKLSFYVSLCMLVSPYTSNKACLFNSSSAVRFNETLQWKDLSSTAVVYLSLVCVQSPQQTLPEQRGRQFVYTTFFCKYKS